MAADFITLACPSCGGKLEFSPSTTSLKCPNCGNEHIVRHEMTNITLESYARCPVCGRNDEVKKVSAILANQTQSMQGVTIEKSSYKDNEGKWHTSTERVPFSGIQSSALAIKLQSPTKPAAQGEPTGCLWWLRYILLLYSVGGFGAAFVVAPIMAVTRGTLTDYDMLLCFFGGITGGPVLLFLFLLTERNYKSKRKEFEKEVQRVSEKEVPLWQHAMSRWNKLYYCFRDDCVFIPGEKNYSESGRMNEYIYSNV